MSGALRRLGMLKYLCLPEMTVVILKVSDYRNISTRTKNLSMKPTCLRPKKNFNISEGNFLLFSETETIIGNRNNKMLSNSSTYTERMLLNNL